MIFVMVKLPNICVRNVLIGCFPKFEMSGLQQTFKFIYYNCKCSKLGSATRSTVFVRAACSVRSEHALLNSEQELRQQKAGQVCSVY